MKYGGVQRFGQIDFHQVQDQEKFVKNCTVNVE